MTPSKVQARKMVLVSAFLLAAIAIYRDRGGKGATQDTFRALWGVGVVSLVLSITADFAPRVAGPFAALAVLGSLTNGGDRLIQSALSSVAAPQTVTPSPGAAQHPDSRGSTRPGNTVESPSDNRRGGR